MLQSAVAFTSVETAVHESEHGNSSADSKTKTLVSCHSVEAVTVFGKEQFPIMHSSTHTDCSENLTFLQNLFTSFSPFVCLKNWNTKSGGEKQEQTGVQQMSLLRKDRKNDLV